MTRLNQSRRQLVGYVYNPQVDNDISQPTNQKSLSDVLEQSFERNMTGGGKKKKHVIKKNVINTSNIKFGKGISLAGGNETEIIGDGIYDDVVKNVIKKVRGKGIKLAKTISNIPGTGLNLPGVGLNLPGTGLNIPGVGLNLPGAGSNKLPGELLRNKILKKLVKQKLMKKMTGGLLNIPQTSSGKSMDKTLPGMKGYVMDGNGINKKGGFFPFIIAAIAAAASAASAVAATTIVGSVTVGSLVGATLTGAATTAGALAIKKIAGEGKHKGKKGGALLETLKPIFIKAAEQAKFTITDFPKKAQEEIVSVGNEVKDNPTTENIKKLGETIAPYARELIKEKITEKVAPKLEKVGLTIGSGFIKGRGIEANKFDNSFVKTFTTELKTSL